MNAYGGMVRVDTSGMRVNVTNETLLDNIRTNIRKGFPQIQPYPIQRQKICLVGGGPSLNDTFEELRKCYFEGDKLVAMNGSAQWLMDHNMRPSLVTMIDARPFNVRFVQEPIPNCKYFISSQCDPSVFDMVADRDSYIFHLVTGDDVEGILKPYYLGHYYNVTGGTTVMLRTIWLCRMLGFYRMEVFGFDSCCMGEEAKHHAYLQPENDGDIIHTDSCAGRPFFCTGWQRRQADDFREFVTQHGNQFQLNVHGDGLIAHMLRTGARLQMEHNVQEE